MKSAGGPKFEKRKISDKNLTNSDSLNDRYHCSSQKFQLLVRCHGSLRTSQLIGETGISNKFL